MAHLGTVGILAPQPDRPHQGNCQGKKKSKKIRMARKTRKFLKRKEEKWRMKKRKEPVLKNGLNGEKGSVGRGENGWGDS